MPSGWRKNMTTSLPVWVLGGLVSGVCLAHFYRPAEADSLIAVALFLMLFPSMLEVDFSRSRRVFFQPELLISALALNFLVSPLLMFGMLYVFGVDGTPRVTAGLILYGTIPCGGMVPAFTGMLGGNVSMSVTITGVSLLLSVVIVPLWMKWLIGSATSVPAMLVFRHLCFIILIPLGTAIAVRRIVVRRKGQRSFFMVKQRLKPFANLGLFLLMFAMSLLYGDRVLSGSLPVLKIGVPVAAFLIILFLLSGLWAKVFQARYEESVAFTLSTTPKNNAISLALAFTTFGVEAGLVNAVAGPLVQLPIMLSFVALMQTRLLS